MHGGGGGAAVVPQQMLCRPHKVQVSKIDRASPGGRARAPAEATGNCARTSAAPSWRRRGPKPAERGAEPAERGARDVNGFAAAAARRSGKGGVNTRSRAARGPATSLLRAIRGADRSPIAARATQRSGAHRGPRPQMSAASAARHTLGLGARAARAVDAVKPGKAAAFFREVRGRAAHRHRRRRPRPRPRAAAPRASPLSHHLLLRLPPARSRAASPGSSAPTSSRS
jgi:hypothetical protein